MRNKLYKYGVAGMLWSTSYAYAADVGVGVVISGEIKPGVYGRVELGTRPPPAVVYAQPVIIVPSPQPAGPIYLHVPPGHAKKWSKHCHKYQACNRAVYFVKSAEYEPAHTHGHEHEHGKPEHGHKKEKHKHGHD